MNLKHINKFFALFFCITILSCKTFDETNKNQELVTSNLFYEIEYSEIISNIINKDSSHYIDYYYTTINFNWKNGKNLNKKFVLKSTLKKNLLFHPLNIFITDNKIYGFDHNSKLIIYNLENGKEIENYKINVNSKNDFSYPTSISKINNSFYVSYY